MEVKSGDFKRLREFLELACVHALCAHAYTDSQMTEIEYGNRYPHWSAEFQERARACAYTRTVTLLTRTVCEASEVMEDKRPCSEIISRKR